MTWKLCAIHISVLVKLCSVFCFCKPCLPYSLTCCLQLLSLTAADLNGSDQISWPAKLKVFAIWPFTERLADSQDSA